MDRIDAWLIERLYSPLAGWLKHHLGVTQWRAAILCLNGSVGFYLAGLAVELARQGGEDPAFVVLLRGLVWLLVLDGARRVALRQAGSSVGVQTARAREWIFRAILIVALPFSLSQAGELHVAFYAASLLGLLSHLYLKASDTPPPAPRGRLAWQRG